MASNNVPTSEEEEDETESSKADAEIFFSKAVVCLLAIDANGSYWARQAMPLSHYHLNINTPPPEK